MIIDWLGQYYVDNAVIITNPAVVAKAPLTASITEIANAIDTQNGIIVRDVSITEAGDAQDTKVAELVVSASQTESAAATDTQDAVAIFNANIIEAASATDTIAALLLLYILKYRHGAVFEKGALKCYKKAQGGWINPILKTNQGGIWKRVDTSGD